MRRVLLRHHSFILQASQFATPWIGRGSMFEKIGVPYDFFSSGFCRQMVRFSRNGGGEPRLFQDSWFFVYFGTLFATVFFWFAAVNFCVGQSV